MYNERKIVLFATAEGIGIIWMYSVTARVLVPGAWLVRNINETAASWLEQWYLLHYGAVRRGPA